MKNLLFIAAVLILSIGCNKTTESADPCVGVKCYNGGICESGTCNCPEGYYGTSCENISSDAFIGDYDCHIVGKFQKFVPDNQQYNDTVVFDCNYTCSILKDPSTTKWILIDTIAPFDPGGGNETKWEANLSSPNSFYMTNTFPSVISKGVLVGFDNCSTDYEACTAILNGNTITLTLSDSCTQASLGRTLAHNFVCTMVKK